MATLFAINIIVRLSLKSSNRTPYEVEKSSIQEKLILRLKYLFPLGRVTFSVISLILFGIDTPTESVAVGALVCFIFVKQIDYGLWEEAEQTKKLDK